MFYYIKGELVYTDPSTAVVDCNGVGYKMGVSKNTLARLTKGAKRSAFIHISTSEKTQSSCLAFIRKRSWRRSSF